MKYSPKELIRRKIGNASPYSFDSVSEMSSTGDNNATSIFRPKVPPSFDDDESILLHKAVNSILDDALGHPTEAFDTVLSRPGAGSLDYGLDGLASVYDSFLSPSASVAGTTVVRADQELLTARDDGPASTESPTRQPIRDKYQRCMWLILAMFVIACTAGGIAGLATVLSQENSKSSATSAERVNPGWPHHTLSPTTSPFLSQSSLLPSSMLSTSPSSMPSSKQTSASPIKLRTSLPTPTSTPTPPPTLSPLPQPMSPAPSRRRTLLDSILQLSPGTESALKDPKSAQSLALAAAGDTLHSLDTFALLTLAYTINISEWSNTSSLTLPCTWTGVTCNSMSSVIKVKLWHRNLIGSLPPELALATNLEVISIAGSSDGVNVKSRINGSIPSLWGELLMNLRVLELYDNRLTGRIPSSIWTLSTLEKLSLDGNQLTGLFPSNVSMMSNLKRLDLSNNSLVGTLPEEWLQLSNLRRLSLANNLLFGTVPTGMGSLRDLQELDLQGNAFRGRVPDTLRLLTNLVWLNWQDNQMTGTLPSVLGETSQLEGLILGRNKLGGSLPSSYGLLANLRILDVSGNVLTGAIPSQWEGLVDMTALSLQKNNLHGQVSQGMCQSLMHIQSDCNADMMCSCCTDCFM